MAGPEPGAIPVGRVAEWVLQSKREKGYEGGSRLPSGPGEGIGWYDQAEGGVRSERSGLVVNRCSGVNAHTSNALWRDHVCPSVAGERCCSDLEQGNMSKSLCSKIQTHTNTQSS